jgi:hypothetical protein
MRSSCSFALQKSLTSIDNGRSGALGGRILLILLLLLLLPNVVAQSISCDIDQGNTKPGGVFDFKAWIRRGSCLHHVEGYASCRNSLRLTLDGLDSLHSAEYSASATILTLLPTVGAVFGTPTADIWILLKVLPFGGAMAILLSFGGSMMPAKSEEYEDNTARAKVGRPGQRVTQGEADANSASDALERLSRKVAEKVQGNQRRELPLLKLFAALFVMMALLSGVLAGMGIIEYGSVYMTWCTSVWWFHLWYITCKCINIRKCHHPHCAPVHSSAHA